jgi:hypothetical protein
VPQAGASAVAAPVRSGSGMSTGLSADQTLSPRSPAGIWQERRGDHEGPQLSATLRTSASDRCCFIRIKEFVPGFPMSACGACGARRRSGACLTRRPLRPPNSSGRSRG